MQIWARARLGKAIRVAKVLVQAVITKVRHTLSIVNRGLTHLALSHSGILIPAIRSGHLVLAEIFFQEIKRLNLL